MHTATFLVDTYATERLKTLSAWAHFGNGDLDFRVEPRERTPWEQMVHQCQSEDGWMRTMLGVATSLPVLPEQETVQAFIEHYAVQSGERLEQLQARPSAWWDEEAQFFDVRRSHAWIMMRRIAHSAHHRGQLTVLLRLLGRELYSTYGPTADTGGLAPQGGHVIYRYPSLDALLDGVGHGDKLPALPGPPPGGATERPDRGNR